MGILQVAIVLILLFALSVPVGIWIYKIISRGKSPADLVLDRVDGFVYRITGIQKDEQMDWKKYSLALLLMNGLMCALLFVVLMFQGYLPLNPNHAANMSPDLAFNVATSFITNTDWQSYSGETISYLAQMFLTAFMFVAPASGLAAAAAFLRGVIGRDGLGNFYVDAVRFTTRLLLPFSIVVAVIFLISGSPQTLSANHIVTTIEGTKQVIPLGPVASLEAIKNLASNGGGFFNANSAHPFENPTPFSNFITILEMGLISTSFVIAFGKMTKNKKQARVLFVTLAVLLVASVGITYAAEIAGNHAVTSAGLVNQAGNMEGKETRFGVAGTSLFSGVTTAYQVGAANGSMDSLTPIGGMMAIWNIILQTVFGGKGTGFIYVIMYAILTVFICGLMVGRTPEYLGKKIEGKEIKMVAVGILAHPLFVLLPVGIAAIVSAGYSAVGNPSFHGFSEMLYAALSASANNGSAFGGLSANTPFWNILLGIVMPLGRYVPLVAMLCAAGSLSTKKIVPESVGTFRTDKAIFGLTLLFIIIVIGALSFFPTLVLGPIAEQLTL
ncbi:MAG: potassium-transporting ATPase subunit KdpA [Ethanoligenens sp.]